MYQDWSKAVFSFHIHFKDIIIDLLEVDKQLFDSVSFLLFTRQVEMLLYVWYHFASSYK